MRAQDLIATAYRRFILEIPALDKLKLVIRLELRGRGDVQVFRVRTPGPEISKGEPENPRLDISLSRSEFNELTEKGEIKHWREAVEHGEIKVGGDPDVIKLLGTVISRHEARAATKRAR